MKKFGAAWLLAAAWSLAAAAPTAARTEGCPGVNYMDQEEAILHLRRMYQEERFPELDATLACLMKDSRTFSSGKPASAAVYLMYRRQMAAPGVNPAEIARVQRWAQQQPTSMFAEFAALRLRYSFSWNVRGGAYASKVSEDKWKGFHEGLAETENAMYRATGELRDSPIWHQLLLALAGDTKTKRADMAGVFDAAVKRWPHHHDLHEVRLTRLVPRWGGSWEEVDAFITRWSGQRQGSESDALYARLYASLLMTMRDNPRATKLEWPRMKRGLEALVTLYPDPLHRNLAATFACVYGDTAYFKSSLQRIPADQLRPAAWLQGTDPAGCAH